MASRSVRPGLPGRPTMAGITELSRSAQIRMTSGWLREKEAARLAATRLAPRPGAALVTRRTWLPDPSDPVRTRASPAKSRPSGERGAAMASSIGELLDRPGHHDRHIDLGQVTRPADPAVPPVPDERGDQADQEPSDQAAGENQQLPGARRAGWRGGAADDGSAGGVGQLGRQSATWLFSESSWLWSEVSCCWAVARCDELLGRLPTSTDSLADADSSALILDCRDEIWLLAADVVLVAV